MKTIKEKDFSSQCTSDMDIISSNKFGWVPTVEEITLDGDVRSSLWRAWES